MLLTCTFRTAGTIGARDVGAAQYGTLFPLTLGDTVLQERTKDDAKTWNQLKIMLITEGIFMKSTKIMLENRI